MIGAVIFVFLAILFGISLIISSFQTGSFTLLIFIGTAILVAVIKNKEERAANEAKYGWDPVRDKFENLPKEQQDKVKQGWDDERTQKREKITQSCRRQKAIPGTISQRLNGKTDFFPSLEDWQDYANDLPQVLETKLLAAAERESWEISKSKAAIKYDQNAYPQALQNLINVYNECEAYKRKETTVEATRKNIDCDTGFVSNDQRNVALCTVSTLSDRDEWDDDW